MTYWANTYPFGFVGEIGTIEIWLFFLTVGTTLFFTLFMAITDKEFRGEWVGFFGAGINWIVERFEKQKYL